MTEPRIFSRSGHALGRAALRRLGSVGLGIVLLGALIFGGCGDPVVGGSGTWMAGRSTEDGALPRLVVRGTPYEMGWWQGRLLREAIRDLHPDWQDAALGTGDGGDVLRRAFAVYVDQVRRRLPEVARQELDGLAAGSGLAAEALLLTEVMRDGLRFHGADVADGRRERLEGILAVEGRDPLRLLLAPTGRDAVLLERAILVERHPIEGPVTTLLAWPGSLGGIAGCADTTGRAVLAVEVAADLQRQSLLDAPFTLLLRRALEGGPAGDDDVLDRLGGATTWRALVANGPAGDVRLVLTGIAAVETADLSALHSFVLLPEGAAGEVVIPAVPTPLPEPRPPGWRFAWTEGAWHVEAAR